jgi:hypothetical protein
MVSSIALPRKQKPTTHWEEIWRVIGDLAGVPPLLSFAERINDLYDHYSIEMNCAQTRDIGSDEV